ncbi:hypothetical protein ACO9S2_10055 [Nitrospira sp. NS4]|uniref:hypothetical protein n=1 Tax=Nitrospira sp. NS4 TaxID=3414498 RepID=UPI003C2F2C31
MKERFAKFTNNWLSDPFSSIILPNDLKRFRTALPTARGIVPFTPGIPETPGPT